MKGFYFILCLLIISLSSSLIAGENHSKTPNNLKKNQWICETNASSSSNPADQKADEMMKKAMHGKNAFEFAMKHCRDCNKITCHLQTTNQVYDEASE
jgi:hypothetical protein